MNSLAAPRTVLVASDRVLAEVAAEIIAKLNVADAVVLLPTLHAASGMARALGAAAQGVVLLPRITTLAEWSAGVAVGQPLQPATVREAQLFEALAGRSWLPDADRWAVAGELAGLFDELTRWHVALPASLADFTRKLAQAYRTKSGASLSFEARVVHELWHAAGAARKTLDAEALYQLQLSALAREARFPLHVVDAGRLTPAERAFFARYAERAPVTMYGPDDTGGGVAQTLHAAWPAAPGMPLRERAAALRETLPASPLAGRLRIVGAESAEAEARLVDVTVREWLLEGRRSIAVIVQDRVIARRARALLERAQVLVRDEAGWALSTTSAATAVGRLLDVVSGEAYHRDLLDLMKSPFAFRDVPRATRQAAVWTFEQALRRDNVVSGLNAYLALAERKGDADVRALLERVAGATREFTRKQNTLAGWLSALTRALEGLGIAQGLAEDAAGGQLLELIRALSHELAGDRLTVSLADWRRWFARKLESATFRDRSIESPVIFTNLAATPLRAFDGVVVVGGDAAHLPGPDASRLFFNQSVRAELGLPVREDSLREMTGWLTGLIAQAGAVVVTWQRRVNGEENLLSPYFERLDTLHHQAWRTRLSDSVSGEHLRAAAVQPAVTAPLPQPMTAPRPAVPAARIPARISASGYNALMACPYQFHARYVLGLGELDEVQEEIDKSDYGQRVHDVLAHFHRDHPVVAELGEAPAIAELVRRSDRAFRDAIAANLLDAAWLARWKTLIPDYVRWQLAREVEGWMFTAAEASRELTIETPGGRSLLLRGRIDRADTGAGGAVAVIDYKTRRPEKLRDALKVPGEDVQLPVYALLWGGPVAAALFLSIERDGVAAVPLEADLAALAEDTRTRLADLYDALHEGAPLPAQGTDDACEYCEMRGLCRRDYWT